jgi:hypothetical protein
MKICLLVFFSLLLLQANSQQRLRDSLYGGRLKADTGKTFVSKDTTKYVMLKNETVSSQPGETKKAGTGFTEVAILDESMPDSLNKLFVSKQKLWKRFIENNTQIVSQLADDTRKVKKGTYEVEVEYEIGLNGRVATKGITCNPPNEFITEQVTEFMKRPPVLSPPIYSDGKPRVLPAKQTITIVKK